MASRHVAAAVVLALGGLSVAIALRSPAYSFAGSPAGAAALLLAGWGLVVAGFLFWRERPGNSVGPLLIATAAAWFVSEWDNPGVDSPIVFTVGLVLHAACPVLVALVMFMHPVGRMSGWPERIGVVSLATGTVLLLGVLTAMSFDLRGGGCEECPDNLILVDEDFDRTDQFAEAGIWVGLVALLGLIGASGWRLLRSSPARRGLVAPGLLAGSLYLAAVSGTFAANANGAFIGSGPFEERLWYAQGGALVLLAAAVVWGRLRSHSTRRSLIDIVVALGKSSSAGGLQAALSDRWSDPELEVGYAIGDGHWADIEGTSVDVTGSDTRTATPLLREGEPVAMIVHRRGVLDNPDLIAELMFSARLLFDNERLRAYVRVREKDLQASRSRMIAAGDAERRRLERDIHDGAQQRLVGLLLGIRLTRARTVDEPLQGLLGEAERELQRAVDSFREVADGIHPAALTMFGLREAVRALGERTGTVIEAHGLPSERLPAEVERAVYQIVADVATTGGDIVVHTQRLDGRLHVEVLTDEEPDSLTELKDRVGALDGWVHVVRDEQGAIRVESEIPCAS